MAQETDPSQNGIFFYKIRGALSSLKTNNQKKAKNKQKNPMFKEAHVFTDKRIIQINLLCSSK